MRHDDFLMLKSYEEKKKEAVQDEVISSTPLPRTQNLIRLKPLPYKIVTFFDWWLCSLVSEPLINIPPTVEPFTIKQLARATKNFGSTHRIDEGTCFKAVLEDGRVLAVKKRSLTSTEDYNEFLAELAILARLKHERFVSLIGWCEEELLLVFDYSTELVSLHQALFHQEKGKLSWEIMFKICLQTVEAFVYLHETAKPTIIHTNLSARSILLDEYFNVKVFDFGMAAKLCVDRTKTIDFVCSGYSAPEYALRGVVTEKTDVYSFGVLIMEIVTGKSNSVPVGGDFEFLIDQVDLCRREGTFSNLADASLVKAGYTKKAVQMLELGILCTSHVPSLRPTMREVSKGMESGNGE